MRKYLLFILLVSLISFRYAAYGQTSSEGYWDVQHAILKEIPLAADKRTWRRVELPPGTKEVGVRITLLDNNQQLTSSFADLLGAIPSTETQIASASINFMSRVVGDDKCTFGVFRNQQDADRFITTHAFTNACYYNASDISRDVIFLRSDRIGENANSLYFAFHSTNLLMSERIILEVVPWVNATASRGWTKEIKEAVLNGCIEAGKQYTDPRAVCQCLLDKIQTNYVVSDIQNMTESEKTTISATYVNECMTETGEDKNVVDKQRIDAQKEAQKGNYAMAISTYLEVVNSPSATAMDYNNLGYYYILSKQFLKAIKFLKIGESIDESELFIKGNLAHAYLFNGDIEQAKVIYQKYRTQNINESISWKEMVQSDFDEFRKQGLQTDNFTIVEELLK